MDEGDAPRADLLAGHSHVLAVDVVADGIKVVNDIHAAVQQVSVQGLVDELGDTTVNDDGVTVRVVVCLGDSLGLIVISSQIERLVQIVGLAVPVRLVNVAGLRDVDRVVGDNVGVAPSLESRVPVAKVGENGLDGLTSCRRVVRAGGFVADGDGALCGSIVDELLLGGGGLLLHHDMYHLSVLVCSPVGAFYCSTNTARLSTRVDKSAVVRVTLDVGARRAVACNQKQYRFSGNLLCGG